MSNRFLIIPLRRICHKKRLKNEKSSELAFNIPMMRLCDHSFAYNNLSFVTNRATTSPSANTQDPLTPYHLEKSFADRRYKVKSARTYFYLNESTCERNMETFLQCLEAVSGEWSIKRKSCPHLTDTKIFIVHIYMAIIFGCFFTLDQWNDSILIFLELGTNKTIFCKIKMWQLRSVFTRLMTRRITSDVGHTAKT